MKFDDKSSAVSQEDINLYKDINFSDLLNEQVKIENEQLKKLNAVIIDEKRELEKENRHLNNLIKEMKCYQELFEKMVDLMKNSKYISSCDCCTCDD
jgi:uncharacterized coiled-coil protein SlyX